MRWGIGGESGAEGWAGLVRAWMDGWIRGVRRGWFVIGPFGPRDKFLDGPYGPWRDEFLDDGPGLALSPFFI